MIPSNNQRRQNEARRLARGCFAYNSVLEALTHLEVAISLGDQVGADRHRIQAHWNTFVIAYSRLFESSNHFGVEKKDLVSIEHQVLHREIIKKHRNSTIAHIDPTDQDLNCLWFLKENGKIIPEPDRFHPSISYLKKCLDLANITLDRIAISISERLSCFPEISQFGDGRYRFDMMAEAGKEWKIEQ